MEMLPVKMTEANEPLEFVTLRSAFLDAFSDLETEVITILKSAGISSSNEPFGNRVQKLREADKTPRIAKANLGVRDQITDGITELLPIRADIVHSRMRIGILDGQPVALFINSKEASNSDALTRILTLKRMQGLVALVERLVKRISDLGRTANPASSLPPPSPGVTGDP